MGRKTKSSNLGRSLIKDRFGANKGKRHVGDKSMLHTAEIQDGYEWGRLNLQSVTEESSFQEFLSTAELAGTEFQAEKLNIKFINPRSNIGMLSEKEMANALEAQQKNKNLIKIPRRPRWRPEMAREELNDNEKAAFLEWRRSLAILQEEEEGVLLTPYEKNLEFWRQLWRVVERSDVVVQIVDARNPLLFRCEDLEVYVKEVSQHKDNLLLINKADFLTEEQRQIWADYFTSIGVRVAFYSATKESEDSKNSKESEEAEETSDVANTKEDQKNNVDEEEKEMEESVSVNLEALKESIKELEESVDRTEGKLEEVFSKLELPLNSSELLTREKLIELFRKIHKGPKVSPTHTTIGLVGYPNVGKSSTINSLLLAKKVSVSATPGKTKHFQTLFLDKDLMLCDCPGLVMPSFVFTKAEMVINGILSIDQMRDHVSPVNLVCHLIPRHVIEDKYGILLPKPMEGEDPDRCPIAEELLNSYAYNRGFMTANGQPDNPRAARYILKDYMNGKLLYNHSPPSVIQADYHKWPERQRIIPENRIAPPRQVRAVKGIRVTSEDVDKVFFQRNSSGVHTKGVFGKSTGVPGQNLGDKPWKKINRHENKNKREKLRRVYAHLDQH